MLSTLKIPREMEVTEGEPTDLIQKAISFVSPPDRVLSEHDLCSPRLQLLTGKHEDLK